MRTWDRQAAKRILLPLLILTLAGLIIGATMLLFPKHYLVAEKGYLDLTKVDLAGEAVPLNGEWAFYPGQLLTPQDFALPSGMDYMQQPRQYARIPAAWNNNLVSGSAGSPYGYATYRLVLKLNSGKTIFGIKTTNIRTANRLFANDQVIGRDGVTGMNNLAGQPSNIPYVRFFTVDSGMVEVIVQVSNYQYSSGGIIGPIYFGSQESILALQEHAVVFDLVSCLCFLIMGIFYAGFYIQRRNNWSPLYLSLFCLAGALYSLTHGEKLLSAWWPGLGYEAFSKIQVCSSILFLLFLAMYMATTYPESGRQRALKLAQGFCVALAIIALIFPVTVYSRLDPVLALLGLFTTLYSIYIMTDAVLRKFDGSVFALTGAVCLTLNVARSTLGSYGIININPAIPVELFGFILSQAFLLSHRFYAAYDTTEKLTDKLLSLDRLKNEFLAKTSYELKTPLNGIINITQTLLEGAAGGIAPQQAENLNIIMAIGKRLHKLVNDVLDFSKMRNQDLALQFGVVDIYAAVQVAMEVTRYTIKGRPIELIDRIHPGVYHVQADEDRLKQIMLNLLDNAAKFTESGNIDVNAVIRGEMLEISVSDSGIGIPVEQQEEIFKPFEQVSSALTRKGGIGIGLSITRQLVKLHGGRIWVESKPGKGSRFTFTLPLSRRTPEGKAATSLNGSPEAEGKVTGSLDGSPELDVAAAAMPSTGKTPVDDDKLNILAVDDEVSNLQVLYNALSMEGYNIITATCGQEAINELSGGRQFELVILDLMMPGMSGYEVCREIRKKHSLAKLPVLLLTVCAGPDDATAGFEAGANDFLTKPYSLSELKARVRTLIQMKTSITAAVSAEMAFLQAQIKPHFLFNVLNTIASFSDNDPAMAGKLIGEFSNYLRCSFDFKNLDRLIALEREISHVSSYLAIEKARFQERLHIVMELENGVLMHKIPPLILQPLVENAVRHGLLPKEEGGTVIISVKQETTNLTITVSDNGTGIPSEKIPSLLKEEYNHAGVGLQNIQRRLENLYGHGLEITSAVGEGTRVTITIPVTGVVAG
jgi:signal transduction histidine kinase/CheY-like chemotaxis protein